MTDLISLLKEHIQAAGGVVICLLIAGYLLQEHIQAAGGFRDAFTKPGGISNTVGIIILFVYPVWAIVLYIL
ncbi:hypothetical protein FF1_034568 [Malus domestica]